jgi:hypothetical protein
VDKVYGACRYGVKQVAQARQLHSWAESLLVERTMGCEAADAHSLVLCGDLNSFSYGSLSRVQSWIFPWWPRRWMGVRTLVEELGYTDAWAARHSRVLSAVLLIAVVACVVTSPVVLIYACTNSAAVWAVATLAAPLLLFGACLVVLREARTGLTVYTSFPLLCPDYILLAPGSLGHDRSRLRIANAEVVVNSTGSDHRCIWADVDVSKPILTHAMQQL